MKEMSRGRSAHVNHDVNPGVKYLIAGGHSYEEQKLEKPGNSGPSKADYTSGGSNEMQPAINHTISTMEIVRPLDTLLVRANGRLMPVKRSTAMAAPSINGHSP
ncbi:hypothetical protein INR49_021473 [Caranx melampygus]|nr:hypothetical protein INR49_021473 [Caranx melampygus]